MFRALKWAFDKGVRQERVRIAAHLETQLRSLDVDMNRFYGDLKSTDSKSKAKQKADFNLAVTDRLKDIVGGVMRPSMRYNSSIMFPEDLKEKENNPWEL